MIEGLLVFRMTSSREVSEMWCLGTVGHGDFARILRVASVGLMVFLRGSHMAVRDNFGNRLVACDAYGGIATVLN